MQDQFTFIHDAILESVTCGDTQISATNLRMNVAKMKKYDTKSGFHCQFKVCMHEDRSCVVLGHHTSLLLDLGAGFS